MREYPATVIEVLDDGIEFKAATLEIVQAFAKTKPWSGSLNARMRKFLTLNQMLAEVEGIDVPELIFKQINGGSSGGSYYEPGRHRIVLTGKLSVVTLLHECGHALGMDEQGACRWSINLFRICFPRQFSRLVHVGHTLVRADDLPKRSVR